MKTTKLLTIGVATSILLLSGCTESSSSDDSSSNGKISSENDAKKAVQAMSMISFSETANDSASQPTQAKQRIAFDNPARACLESGTIASSGDISIETGSSTFTTVSDNCVQFNQRVDGTFKFSGNLQGEYNYEFIGFEVDNNSANTVSNFTSSFNVSSDFKTLNSTMDGKVDYLNKVNTNTGYIQYNSFQTALETNLVTAKVSYSGSISTTSSLYPCTDGTYEYTTIEALTTSAGNAQVVQSGELDINGAVFTFNNGQVSVSTADGESFTIDQATAPTCD